MNPTPHIVESALLLLAAFLIGCVIGYVLRKMLHKPTALITAAAEPPPKAASKSAVVSTAGAVTAPSQPVSAATPKRPAAKKKAPAKATRSAKPADKPAKVKATPKPAKPDEPVLLDAPRGGSADDLKKIKGIGPKLETVLNQNGVYHYDQIAAWNTKVVAIMDEKLSFKGRIDREAWVSQAKALSKKG